MPLKLSKSALSVQEELSKLQLECEVLALPSSTRTAAEAASSIGCDIAQIVKSLIFKTKNMCKPVLVLASGSNQVEVKAVEKHLGESITKADADFVRHITGFAIGGVPPIGHKNSIDFVYIDQALVDQNEVWAAAGTPNTVFCIKSDALLKAIKGNIITLSKGDM